MLPVLSDAIIAKSFATYYLVLLKKTQFQEKLDINVKRIKLFKVKAILEFSLPEETTEHEDAVNGTKWKLVAWELDQFLRNYVKHGGCDDCEDNKYSAFEFVRTEIYNLMQGYNLSFDD